MAFAALLVLMLVWYFISAPTTPPPTANADETVKMVNPIYKGRTGDGLPYRIMANDAVRFIQNPDEVRLSSPILSFLRDGGAGESTVLAVTGFFDSKAQVLELKQNVNLNTDDGYACKTNHSRVFVKGKRIEGDELINCTGNFGQAQGNAYEINENYTEFVFKNGMTARLIPEQADDSLGLPDLRGPQETKPEPKPSGPDVSFGNNDPVDVKAERAVYIGPKTILTGDVDVRQLEARIVADRMDLFREKIEIEGSDKASYGNINRIIAIGSFKYSTPENSVKGNKGVYERDKNIITVTGNVTFTQENGNSVSGDKMVYDLTANRVEFGGNCVGKNCKTDKRVNIRIGQ